MRTTLVPAKVLDQVKRYRALYQAARDLRMVLGRMLPPRRVPGIEGRVHHNDFMLMSTSADGVSGYRDGALDVIDNIEHVLDECGRTVDDVDNWLDFGCGYGRVIRFLLRRVPPHRVSGVDVIGDAVGFCAREFGVWASLVGSDFDTIELGEFDFVFAISVMTHIPPDAAVAFLRFIRRATKPGGIAMFTTQGEACLHDIAGQFSPRYADRAATIRESYARDGMAYVPYGYYKDDRYGLSWYSREFVDDNLCKISHGDMRRVWYRPDGLHPGHQDVHAFRRTG
jgi:SAM-dependent methyltransferase